MDSSIVVSGCVIVVVCALPSPHRVAGKQSSSTFGNLFFFHGCHRDDGYVLASHEKAINLSLELWYGMVLVPYIRYLWWWRKSFYHSNTYIQCLAYGGSFYHHNHHAHRAQRTTYYCMDGMVATTIPYHTNHSKAATNTSSLTARLHPSISLVARPSVDRLERTSRM